MENITIGYTKLNNSEIVSTIGTLAFNYAITTGLLQLGDTYFLCSGKVESEYVA